MESAFLKTNLRGKINNLDHFKNEALLPVFEAVVNSIHAIEDSEDFKNGRISINIIREKSLADFSGELDEELLSDSEDDDLKIRNIEIIDNGIGFTNDNYESFSTSDSTYKLKRGGKGVGRFFWLKAFDRVDIESVYFENGARYKRIIQFSSKNGIEQLYHDKISEELPIETKVRLIGFIEEYRKQRSAYKTPSKIAQRILEHCLSYFIAGFAPTITLNDGNKNISLNSLFDSIKDDIYTEDFEIKGHKFSISHIKLYSTNKKAHSLVFCADHRDVTEYPINSLLGTSSLFDDVEKKFEYVAYVSSIFLDEYVDSTRRHFNIPDYGDKTDLYGFTKISIDTIKSGIIIKSKEFLSEYLDKIKDKKTQILYDYVSLNPSLRAVLKYCPDMLNDFELNSDQEKINEVLYKYKGEAEYKIKQKHNELLKTQVNSVEEIKNVFSDLSQKIEDFNRDQLAGYILNRKMILDLLEKKIQLDDEDKYSKESIVHDIIFPRKTNSDEINYEDHNLWIIDEQLTFHRFATSDSELKGFSSSNSKNRPDLIIFSETDEDKCARSVSIIEFKQPQREKFEKDPIYQMYDTIEKIKKQEIKVHGRVFHVTDATKFYCYAICDLTEVVRKYATYGGFSKLKDELGYYSYNAELKAHTEILDFDKLVSDAKKRHKIFFEKLGISNM